ncbi:MAG: universal stress protein [Alphaproteobacteria bacterium]|jgi:nucleotide-binding universal stress UspA family protein|nr:universal stress protein [Alphaproteobacteria bacterium]MDP6818476.1 universal stress protein [Alphaproteobacteria bacterium]
MNKSRDARNKDHVAGQITFLVCVAHDDHSAVAARFAAMRAQNSGGAVALLHVTQPPEFQHWAAVGERMREETREDAQALFDQLAGEVEALLHFKPTLHIREGSIGEEIIAHIEQSETIDLLVVGAAPPDDGHGSLISWLAGQLAGRLNIPLVVVPGNLSDQQLRDLT